MEEKDHSATLAVLIRSMTKAHLMDLLRPPVRALRSFRDRILHPIRRRRAERMVSSVYGARSVLFLCTGNICRSPYAEKVFRRAQDRLVEGGAKVSSAGFLRPDRPSPEPAIRVAHERGISLEAHRSRQADAQMLTDADLIVAMETGHRAGVRRLLRRNGEPVLLLGDLDPVTPHRREIQDPWGRPDEAFREAFERIDRCAERLCALLDGASG